MWLVYFLQEEIMESLRKYLGYVVFGLFALAAVLGVIFKLTDHLADQLKNIKSFDAFLFWAAAWLSRVVCWTVIAVMAIIAMVKLSELDAQKADNKVVKLVAIAALAEFLALLLLLILAIKNNAIKGFGGKSWAVLIISGLVLVGAIVRKVSFANNNFVAKIMAAALALVMFVLAIVMLGDLGKTDKTCFIFFIIAYVGAIAHPLLSSELK